MTATAFAEDVQASLGTGMSGHPAKPIVMDEVFRAIVKNRNCSIIRICMCPMGLSTGLLEKRRRQNAPDPADYGIAIPHRRQLLHLWHVEYRCSHKMPEADVKRPLDPTALQRIFSNILANTAKRPICLWDSIHF